MNGPEHLIEFFHGYTYSGNPASSAASLATLDIYQREGLLTRASEMAKHWEDALLQPEGPAARHRHPRDRPGRRGRARADRRRAGEARLQPPSSKSYEEGIMIRTTGDTIAMSPPLII